MTPRQTIAPLSDRAVAKVARVFSAWRGKTCVVCGAQATTCHGDGESPLVYYCFPHGSEVAKASNAISKAWDHYTHALREYRAALRRVANA